MAKRRGDHKASAAPSSSTDSPVIRAGAGRPMTTLLFVAAIIAAATSIGYRRWQRVRLRRASRRRLGASPGRAILVRSYSDIDRQLAGRWCHCGGYLERAGEGTREQGGRRYRVASLRCQECEARHQVFFDVTEMLH